MDDDLRSALEAALASGRDANPALDQLLSDYVRYHAVLAAVGSVLLVGVVALAWWTARRARAVRRTSRRRWSVERWALIGTAVGSALVAAMLAVVVAANVSTVVAPQRGFEGAVAGVDDARPGSHRAEVQQAYAEWLDQRSSSVPPGVEAAVSDRLAWQAPKAVVTAVLLALAAWWLVRVVRRMSSTAGPSRPARARSLLALGASSAAAFVLMLMVMGNTQAAIAPVAITMFLG